MRLNKIEQTADIEQIVDIEQTVDIEQMGMNAKQASVKLALLPTDTKNEALCAMADALEKRALAILEANAVDVELARQAGISKGMIDRLSLSRDRICSMATGLRDVAKLPDPIGEVMEDFTRPNGLRIIKKRVPMGVIGIIYESRPNVTSDAAAIAFKSGSACILKGGSDALHSNKVICDILRDALESSGLPRDAIQLIPSADREYANQFMRLNRYVDVLIPRGGAGLINNVVEHSTVPVIKTGTGNCHVYVDCDANLEMAVDIVLNAKTSRVGVCNACESLLVHEAIANNFIPMIARALRAQSVDIKGDDVSVSLIGCDPATDDDYAREYLDYVISMKTVSSVAEAVEHINKYGTGHSETIVTENHDTAEYFLAGVDAACVYHNASTRFTDGGEFGFGAEIGISTQKLHARGPMGLKELTSYKYVIYGDGQVRS